MELSIAAGTPLKHFTRALACLTKFGEDIDIACTSRLVKLSSVNASRSAFGVVAFKASFFSRYEVLGGSRKDGVLSFSITGKALLSALRPRSTNTVESVSIHLTDDDPSQVRAQGDSGECRLVVTLHCQHGVIKTHRLTYGTAGGMYARATRASYTSSWVASSRILKDWTDHFHLRSGSSAASTDEISFYHGQTTCRLKSFGVAPDASADDPLTSRPMSTELSVDVEDFDTYSIPSTSSYEGPLITFALKEFKAIINLAETVAAPLDAAFERGGVPILIAVEGDEFNADFVIATTDFDSGDNGGSEAGASAAQSRVKRESMPPPPARRSTSAATTAGGATGSNKGKGKEREVPLFNPASQDQHGAAEEEEDEYGDDGGEFDEQAFAQIDFISQQVISASQAPTTAAGSKRGRGTTLVPDTAEEEEEVKPTQLGPTQGGEGEDGGMDVDEQGGGAMKKAKWNLFDS